MPATTVFYRVQGEDVLDDQAEVRNWKEATEIMKDFFSEAQAASDEDGETREVGIVVNGNGKEEENEEDEEEEN